jgi:ribosomal protein S18 acetylase RimI-like enzyme
MTIVEASGQFDADSLAFVRKTLDEFLAGESSAVWLTATDPEPVGVACCAPEPVAPGTWNLLMLWTRADRHGRGHGAGLVAELESLLKLRNGRLLIVETSSLPAFGPARSFYAKSGFTHEATIKHFFAQDDHKLVFTKPM